MQRIASSLALRVARIVSLAVLAVIGTTVLMQLAPGYKTDEREMDSRYAARAEADLAQQEQRDGTVVTSLWHAISGWFKGDLGTSRQFQIPVSQLLRERAGLTALLVTKSLIVGWLASLACALLLSTRKRRRGESIIALSTTALLCVPVALLATACLLLDCGGPVFVLATLIAVRDFKLLQRVLGVATRSYSLLYARSQGYTLARLVQVHLLQTLRKELLALGMMSLVVALSAAVPVEVIFDKPGLGQLAWSAAMNRDLPVLVAVTLLMAAIVGLSSFVTEQSERVDQPLCG